MSVRKKKNRRAKAAQAKKTTRQRVNADSRKTKKKATVKRARKTTKASGKKRTAKQRPQPTLSSLFLRHAVAASSFVFLVVFALTAFSALIIRELPDTSEIWLNRDAPGVTLVAADGSPIPRRGRLEGAPVRLAELPPHVPAAILAIEDRNFYHHAGVNVFSILRAMSVNLRSGEIAQGGSTITQQLAKLLFLTPERTISRKIRELYLAFWLELRFTKDEILSLYLNRAYFGAGAYGVSAASFRYFDKSPSDLTVAEAALLAGLLKAPSTYDPFRAPEKAGVRTGLVLDAMVDNGHLGYFQGEEERLKAIHLATKPGGSAPYFADYAARAAHRAFPTNKRGIRIRTTLAPDLQLAVENGLHAATGIRALPAGAQFAAVLLDQNGAIRALVGGRDYSVSQFNRGADARRQPGSAFKPFLFLAAMEQGMAPSRRVLDQPVRVDGWAPANYKDKYLGDITLATALSKSQNAAAVRLQEEVGRSAVRLAARRMGLNADLSHGAALSLGVDVVTPLDLAGAYAPFANGGFRVTPYGVEQIDDLFGRQLWFREDSFKGAGASLPALDAVNRMLIDVVENGTGREAFLSNAIAAGKTGTSQDGRDTWFVGHADGLTLAVWIGRDDNKPMWGATGGNLAAVYWREVMQRVVDQRRGAASPALARVITPSPSLKRNGQE